MRRILLSMTALLLTAAIAGCLISGTKIFEFDVVDFYGTIVVSGSGGPQTFEIDLSNNDVFEEHKDDIKRIDRVGFEAEVYTNNSTDASFSVSFQPGLTGPFLPVLVDLAVRGSSTNADRVLISYSESESKIQNFAAFQAALESGLFNLRLEAGGAAFDITVAELLLIITFTVGL